MDVGHLPLLARLSGTLCPRTCGIRMFLRTVTGSHWRRFYLHSTSVFSALEVFFYENALYKFTFDIDIDIWHTVMNHSSASTYILQFVDIGKTSCRWPDIRTNVETGWVDVITSLKFYSTTLWSQIEKPIQTYGTHRQWRETSDIVISVW